MLTVLKALKNAAVGLLWVGITYALLFYVAHFSEVQSAALAIVGVCAIDGYRLAIKAAANDQPKFEPFWVRIEPNWYALCQDFGLFDVERWTELQSKCNAIPSEYSILRNGFNFTMLSPTLFFSNDHNTFFSELDFKVPVEELKPEKSHRPFGPFAPRFYVKRMLAGHKKDVPAIEIGLVTEESLKKSHHPADDEAEMPVAWLPEIVFFGYLSSDAYNYDTRSKIEERTKAQLAEFGWTQKERDPEDSWLNWPFEIDHKYVRVTYRAV